MPIRSLRPGSGVVESYCLHHGAACVGKLQTFATAFEHTVEHPCDRYVPTVAANERRTVTTDHYETLWEKFRTSWKAELHAITELPAGQVYGFRAGVVQLDVLQLIKVTGRMIHDLVNDNAAVD